MQVGLPRSAASTMRSSTAMACSRRAFAKARKARHLRKRRRRLSFCMSTIASRIALICCSVSCRCALSRASRRCSTVRIGGSSAPPMASALGGSRWRTTPRIAALPSPYRPSFLTTFPRCLPVRVACSIPIACLRRSSRGSLIFTNTQVRRTASLAFACRAPSTASRWRPAPS